MAATPPQPDVDTAVADTTLYFEIDVGLDATNKTTGVYVPDLKQLGKEVDVVLYFHGHKDDKTKTIKKVFTDDRNLMREALAQSKKKHFVFVAPQLGSKAEGGDLGTGVQDLLEQVMNGLGAYMPLSPAPTVGNIVLAAHSGGGELLRPVAKQSYVDPKLLEVWCFDCLYASWKDPSAARSDATYWIDWKKSHTQQRLAIFYLPEWDKNHLNTATNSKRIKKAFKDGTIQNVVALELTSGVKDAPPGFKTGPVQHPSIPATYLQSLLDTATGLS